MPDKIDIVVVGAGIAGLACARRLAEAGHSPVVLDKGRGIGGRLATRRGESGISFDHGAQYVTARTEGFRQVLDLACASGHLARWEDGSAGAHFVGTPGMTALAKFLAQGLDVRQEQTVTSVTPVADGWQVATSNGNLSAGRVVLTAPAPQTAALLGAQDPVARQLAQVSLDPCLTLMAALTPEAPRPFVARADADDALSWIAQNSTKPGRTAAACWVAQASPDWSRAHLELDRPDIAERLLVLLLERLGARRDQVVHAAGHRWRHARVAQPLGAPFARNAEATLYAGGDWCIEARVEAAWISGTAIAEDLAGLPATTAGGALAQDSATPGHSA
jgi:predicted NAD/FAD-dependent oxidoreductase